MMRELQHDVSCLGVARHYGRLLDALVIDEQDRSLLTQRTTDDPDLVVMKTVMKTRDDRVALARECLGLLEKYTASRRP